MSVDLATFLKINVNIYGLNSFYCPFWVYISHKFKPVSCTKLCSNITESFKNYTHCTFKSSSYFFYCLLPTKIRNLLFWKICTKKKKKKSKKVLSIFGHILCPPKSKYVFWRKWDPCLCNLVLFDRRFTSGKFTYITVSILINF